ncbi:hypothetical protein B9Z55_000864 [Caenorhabditis nigoni]|uniref:RanBP2-type domain-containing protein n=1 Tax=Caenorhabditis nigoni TaxID=1611254 RepID=A0A2G5VV84_9PELO|nr:hypothetical protein B9Z55_000864 [Caenorhabditis nigoni]
MSDKSGGFLSSVSRFFSGGSASKKTATSPNSPSSGDGSSPASPSTAPPATFLRDIIGVDSESAEASNEVAVDTTQNARIGSRLRHLSPSALDRNVDASNGLQIEVDPEQDIFFNTPSISTNRKRQLTELERQDLPHSFRSDSVKRSRYLNRSLLEPTLKGTLTNDRRLDMSWCGGVTGNHSPASSVTNFSLLSRRSGATTNGSLSSRTQEIFKRLENANTPAKDVQRMTMLRAGLSRPESWGPSQSQGRDASSTATPPPPLKKAGDAIPSRIQLISKSLSTSARRTPYWTDLTRKRTISRNGDNASESSSLKMLNGTLACTELSSVFSLDPPAPKKMASSSSSISTATMNSTSSRILKGPDGKPVSRNTFKLTDDLVEENDDSQKLPPIPESLTNAQTLKLAPESAPKRGFLDNLSFSFSAPLDVVAAVGTAKTVSIASSIRSSSESKEVDSDSGESTDKPTSDGSSDESGDSDDDGLDEVKESRPQTSADTITSAEGSSNQSSKDSSPKTAKDVDPIAPSVVPTPVVSSDVKWVCQECYCSWPESDSKCGTCETPRGGTSSAAPPAQKQLVSNISSFAPPSSSAFKFGFGGSSSSASTATTSAITPFGNAATSKPTETKSTPAAVVVTTAPTVPVVAPPTAAPIVPPTAAPTISQPSGDRVDWLCPDCCVSNKATDDKCICCGHQKYASATSSSNVFGNRAFKPSAATSGISFGVGGGAVATSSATQPSFGFGAKSTSQTAPTPAFSAPPVTSQAAAPNQGFGISTEKPTTTTTKAPELSKPVGSLFGNLNKPAESTAPKPDSTAAPFPTPSTSSLFGNKSLFETTKAAEPAKESTLSIFGKKEVSTPSVTPATSSTSSTSLAPPASSAPQTSLFGTSTSSFGGASLFGASKPAVEPSKQPSTSMFGTPSSISSTSSDVPKASIFGAVPSSTSSDVPKASIFGAAPSSSTAPPVSSTTSGLFGSAPSSTASLFGAASNNSGGQSLFGGKPIQFASEVGTTTTDGGAPAKRGLFSSDSSKLSFKSDQKVDPLKFGGFGGSTTSSAASSSTGPSIFGTSSGGSLFGASNNNTNTFNAPGSTSGTAPPPAFGSSTSTPFGGSSSSTGFGGFNSTTTQPGMSTSSSSTSLFGQNPPDSTNPFGGSSNTNGSFNFGGSNQSSTGSQGVFQFGAPTSQAPPAAPGGAFQFGAPTAQAPPAAPGGGFQFGNNLSVPQPPAPGSMDNAFAYQAPSNGSRKMAMARRRNIRK